jgi:KAP family P-loop domain
MKIKHEEIAIDPSNPFANCKLERKKYADVLTKIVGIYADGFVLAINNEWGTGKTTFVKMWRHELINNKYQTLYFNAWENDFESSPLVALMAELNSLTNKKTEVIFKSLIKKGAVVTKTILPAILKAIAAKYIDKEIISDAVENLTKAATEILEDEIKDYATKKKGLIEFKIQLEKFVKEITPDKPLIFIIDELDRCRPNYAVEVLEQIKHFFSVKGIVFILSIDKSQLGNAVRGVYGSENIDADEYLRRFIDLEYTIPSPTTKLFCQYLYKYFEFDDFFFADERKNYHVFKEDKNTLIDFSSILFENNKLPLRQQEKIFARAKIVLKSFEEKSYVFPTIFIFLIYLRDKDYNFYKKIMNKELTLQSLIDGIEDFFPPNIDYDNLNFFIHTEALMTYFYSNSFKRRYNSDIKLFEKKEESAEDKLTFKSGIDSNDGDSLLRQIKLFQREHYSEIELDFFISKIDLLDPLNG